MKRLTVLALMFSCTAVAEAASKPLDGRWKWLKSTCERKTINEVMTEMTTMNVTLKNGAGKIELNIMPPFGRRLVADLSKVEYELENQVVLECADEFRNSDDSDMVRFCKHIGRTFTFEKKGTKVTLTYEDPDNCATAPLVDFYERMR